MYLAPIWRILRGMGDSREPFRLGHRPALDGLRGVAILLVLACHTIGNTVGPFSQYRALGSAGVMLFFPLSGFLITSLLLEEHAVRGRVSLAGFYRNRAIRLFPALVAVLVLVWVFQAGAGVQLMPNAWAVLAYAGNWAQAAGADLGVLNPAWSLAIEEQFYIVWPLVLLGSMRWRNGPMIVTVVGLGASVAERFLLVGHVSGARIYMGSDTQASCLLAGCLLALLVHRGLRPSRMSGWAAGLLAFSLVGWAAAGSDVAADLLVPTIVPWVGVVLIWSALTVTDGPLCWGWLRYLGRRSYALYLWHSPVIAIVCVAGSWTLPYGLLGAGLSVLVAEGSWRLVEKPWRRFRSEQRLDGRAIPPAERVHVLDRGPVPVAQQGR